MGGKHQKYSGASQEPAVEVGAPSSSGTVWYHVREDQQCCMSASSRLQGHSGQGLYCHGGHSAFKKVG